MKAMRFWSVAIVAFFWIMAASVPAAEEEKVRVISLSDCLQMAFKQNISFISVGESVRLREITRALTRHDYGLLFTGTASAEYSGGEAEETELTEQLEVSVSQLLPTGGEAELSSSATGLGVEDGEFDQEFSSNLQLTLTQPLLQGSGRLVYREELTQVERRLVYAVRALELAKQDLAIDTVSLYYDVLGDKKITEIFKSRLDDARLQRQRSEARFSVGKERGVDLARAKIQESSAEQAYRDQVVAYERSLDDLKLFLNLSIEETIALVPEEISYVPVKVDLKKCIGLARQNRLDLLNARERLEDAERHLILAREKLRNPLDLVVGSAFSSEDDWDWTVGLAFTLPLDKWQERSDYESQIIGYSQTRRDTKRTEDEVVLGVIETLRSLRRSENTIRIQDLTVEDAARRLEQAKIDYSRGKGTNRDVVEAQNELASAQNELVRAKIDYIIGKLELQREIGTLLIDEEGNWLHREGKL